MARSSAPACAVAALLTESVKEDDVACDCCATQAAMLCVNHLAHPRDNPLTTHDGLELCVWSQRRHAEGPSGWAYLEVAQSRLQARVGVHLVGRAREVGGPREL